MQDGGYGEHGDKQHDEYDIGRRPALKHKVDGRADEYDHHDDGVEGAQDGRDDELVGGLHQQADEYEASGRNDGHKVGPVEADPEHGVVGTRRHQQYGSRSEDRGCEHQELVQQVESTNVVINLQDKKT